MTMMTGEATVQTQTVASVSVVICAYTLERWDLLRRAVESVQAQVPAPKQLLLCVDHNEELAERSREAWPEFGQERRPAVQVLTNKYAGRLGSARNTAVEVVTAEVTAFLDDDAACETGWLRALLEAYDETGAMAVGGAPLPVFETRKPAWFPEEFFWVFGCHYRGLPDARQSVRHLIGASMTVRTSALHRIGGFWSDDHDDMDMCHRIAAEFGPEAVVYEPSAKVRHFVSKQRVTWAYFWRRCYQVNKGKVQAFNDMGKAGNLTAELQFVIRAAYGVAARLASFLSRGDPAALGQCAAIISGVALAGLGHIHGKIELRLHGKRPSLTRGLCA